MTLSGEHHSKQREETVDRFCNENEFCWRNDSAAWHDLRERLVGPGVREVMKDE